MNGRPRPARWPLERPSEWLRRAHTQANELIILEDLCVCVCIRQDKRQDVILCYRIQVANTETIMSIKFL